MSIAAGHKTQRTVTVIESLLLANRTTVHFGTVVRACLLMTRLHDARWRALGLHLGINLPDEATRLGRLSATDRGH